MTPELEAQSEVHKTGHRWIDISVAGCALIVSVTSLCVAIIHGKTMERMADANARLVSANSWPVLQRYESDLGGQGERVVSLNVTNSGVGPAKVEAVELSWRGRPMRTVDELLEACCQGADAPGAVTAAPAGGTAPVVTQPSLLALRGELETSSLHGSMLKAGDSRRIFELRQTTANEAFAGKVRLALKETTMRACYCSVFDECWTTDLQTLQPQSVKQCAVPEKPFAAN